MKVKKSQLKKLVKEVIHTAITEVDGNEDWTIEGDSLFIEGLELEDGRVVDVKAWLKGEWESTGIGSYEYWGAKGFDKGRNQYSLYDFVIMSVTDNKTRDVIWKSAGNRSLKVVDAKMYEEISDWIDSHRDDIEQYMTENADEGDPRAD